MFSGYQMVTNDIEIKNITYFQVSVNPHGGPYPMAHKWIDGLPTKELVILESPVSGWTVHRRLAAWMDSWDFQLRNKNLRPAQELQPSGQYIRIAGVVPSSLHGLAKAWKGRTKLKRTSFLIIVEKSMNIRSSFGMLHVVLLGLSMAEVQRYALITVVLFSWHSPIMIYDKCLKNLAFVNSNTSKGYQGN